MADLTSEHDHGKKRSLAEPSVNLFAKLKKHTRPVTSGCAICCGLLGEDREPTDCEDCVTRRAEEVADEQTTTTTAFEFDPRWAGPVKEMHKDRELHDVVLSAGDVSVAAHRVILAAASPHLRGLFREPRAGGGDGNGYCEESRTNRLYVTCADIASLPQFQGQ